MPRRCPPYQLKRSDLLILIEAGKTATEAAEITGWDATYIWHLAAKMGVKFKDARKGPKRKGRAYLFADTQNRKSYYPPSTPEQRAKWREQKRRNKPNYVHQDSAQGNLHP